MRLHHTVLLTLLVAPALVSAQDNLGTYEDRIAVEDVMARYVWAVDSFDADGYVAVFTGDAVIDSNGSISKGHDAIRKVVTGLIERRDANKAKESRPGTCTTSSATYASRSRNPARRCTTRTGRPCAATPTAR